MQRRFFIGATLAALSAPQALPDAADLKWEPGSGSIDCVIAFDPFATGHDFEVKMPAALAYIWDERRSIMHCVKKGYYSEFSDVGSHQPKWQFEPDAGHVKSVRFEPRIDSRQTEDLGEFLTYELKIVGVDVIDITDTAHARESRIAWLQGEELVLTWPDGETQKGKLSTL